MQSTSALENTAAEPNTEEIDFHLELQRRVPENGERVSCGNLDVLVTKVDNHRIEEIQLTQKKPAQAPAAQA